MYNRFQIGKTTEEEFRKSINKASVHHEVVDGQKAIMRECGWELYGESRTEHSTLHFYKVYCPNSEDAYKYGERRIPTLFYATFRNGILFSITR